MSKRWGVRRGRRGGRGGGGWGVLYARVVGACRVRLCEARMTCEVRVTYGVCTVWWGARRWVCIPAMPDSGVRWAHSGRS